MTSIDIRNESSGEITQIVFANSSENEYNCSALVKLPKEVYVVSDCTEWTEREMRIMCKEDAINLIKAVERAIQLGWFN